MVLGTADASAYLAGQSSGQQGQRASTSALGSSQSLGTSASSMAASTAPASASALYLQDHSNLEMPAHPTSGGTLGAADGQDRSLAVFEDSTYTDTISSVDSRTCLLQSSSSESSFGETSLPDPALPSLGTQPMLSLPQGDAYDNPQCADSHAVTDTVTDGGYQASPLPTSCSSNSQAELLNAVSSRLLDQAVLVGCGSQSNTAAFTERAAESCTPLLAEEVEGEAPCKSESQSLLEGLGSHAGKAEGPLCLEDSLMDILQGNLDLLNPYGIQIESIEPVGCAYDDGDDDDDDAGNKDRPSAFQSLLELSTYVEGGTGGMAECTMLNQACQQALYFSSQQQLSKGEDDKTRSLLSLFDFTPIPRKLDVVPSNKHLCNVIWLSIAITMMFIALGSVRNLQSSINHEGGVGLISLAVSAAGYLVCSLVSSVVVQRLHPRRSIILCLVPHLLYVAANLYPRLWLMVLASLLQGAALSILWNASSTYITFLARGQAEQKQEHIEHVTSRYFGIFCLIYQLSYIIGNLIASLVLMLGSAQPEADVTEVLINSSAVLNGSVELYGVIPGVNDSVSTVLIEGVEAANSSSYLHLCGTAYCHHYTIDSMTGGVDEFAKNLLFGIYMGCVVVAILIAVFLLEPLNPLLLPQVQSWQQLGGQLADLARFLTNRRFLLLVPILFYANLQLYFASAEVVKSFVTCALGIHMVGYVMICMAVSGCLSSYISGILNRVVGRIPLLCLACLLNLGLLVFLSVWQPTPDSLAPYFLVFGVWGLTDGIFLSQLNSIIPVVFPEQFEDAYTGMRVAQGLAGVVMMFSAQSMCMACKIYIVIGLCIVSLFCYLLLELLLHRQNRRQRGEEVTVQA